MTRVSGNKITYVTLQ